MRRISAFVAGARWGSRSLSMLRRELDGQGLNVVVERPPTTDRGSLRGARVALFLRRAACLERSLVVQRWWAARGIALDVVVGVRHPGLHKGAPGHAWVERWDADCSDRFAEIRRVAAPEGERPVERPSGE